MLTASVQRRLPGVAVLFFITASGIAAGASVVESPRAIAYFGLGAAMLCCWYWVAKASSAALAAALLLLLAGLLLPTSTSYISAALLLGFVLWQSHTEYRGRAAVPVACLALIGLWLLLGLNPNTPDFSTALLGTRKTTFVLMGFAAGAVWPRRTAHRAEDLLTVLLAAGAVVSLAIHVLAPGYEQHFVRAASVYTSEFAGKARMQGIYAGPTHIALLGAFLGLRGWHLWIGGRSRRNAGALIALGGALVYEADVRTAFLVLGVGIVLTMLLRRPREARHAQVLMRTLVVGTILVAIIASGHVHNDALSSIPGLGQDHRATTRLGLWQTGWDYFKQSPLYGLGPGSGSSTMALRFAIGRHVTGDNEYVAILVEGGLIGVAAMFWLFGTIRRHTRDLMSPDHASSSALVCLALFALTGNIFEATPISLILAAFIGLRVTRGGAFDQRDLASPEQLT